MSEEPERNFMVLGFCLLSLAFPPKSIGLQFLRTLASSMMFVVDWVDLQLAWIFCIMLVVFQVM